LSYIHKSDHCLTEWVQLHTCLASALAAALLVEEAGGEVDLSAANSQDSDELNEGHPSLASRGGISD
jgi:hypothetical protein